jgi:hypothetical protein
MLRQFCFSRFLAILAFLGSLPGLAQASRTTVPFDPQIQSQLGKRAGRVLIHADITGCHGKSCTILVANFAGPSGSTALLSLPLADAISTQLALQAKDIQIVDRSWLQSFLDKERIPSKLFEDDRAMGWLASKLSASAVLVGYLEKEKTGVYLSIPLQNAQNAAKKT